MLLQWSGYGFNLNFCELGGAIVTKDENIVCEVWYCPECGTEIFCDAVPESDLLFYPSAKMDESIEECPECGLDFAGLTLHDFDGAPDRREKGSPQVRTTAGKKEMVNTITEAAPDEFATNIAAGRALDAVRDALLKIVSTGEDLRWSGIGTFKIKQRKSRRVRNPQTGEMMVVPAKKAIRFAPAKKLREIVEKQA